MQLRYGIGGITTLFMTLFFQYYILNFNTLLHTSQKLMYKVEYHFVTNGYTETAEGKELRMEILTTMKDGAEQIAIAMYVSMLNLVFPITLMIRQLFLHKTKRYSKLFDGLFFIDLFLFLSVVRWIYEHYKLQKFNLTN